MTDALEPEVVRGLAQQRHLLDAATRAGAAHVGWKVGFGSVSGLQLLGLSGPIIGHLLDSGELADGSEVPIAGWTGAVIEAEIACWIAREIPADVVDADIPGYVAAVGPALEVADVDHRPEDSERILAGNIFHRGYVLGRADPSLTLERAGALAAQFRHGDELIEVTDSVPLTGRLPAVLARAARQAPLLGRPMRAGDVVLLGSIIAPRPVVPGDGCAYRLDGLPELTISFA